MEQSPEVRPRRKSVVESFVAERARLKRENAPVVPDPSTALEPDEIDTTVELPPDEIAALEDERRQLQEAMAVPKTPAPEAPPAPRPRKQTAVKRAEVEDVESRLKDATTLVQEHEAKIAAAEEADRLAKIRREQELEAARQQLGIIESEQTRLAQRATVGNLAVIADRFKEGSSENAARGQSSAAGRRREWEAKATPMLKTIFAFEAELQAFLRTHAGTLEFLSNLTWEKVDARYRVKDRTAIVDRASRPARELLTLIRNTLRSIEEIAARAEAVLDGRLAPDPTLLARIENCSRYTIKDYNERLAVLSTSVAQIEERAEAYATKPGGAIREVRTITPLPKPPGADVAEIRAGWDPHGSSKQNG